MLATDFDVYFDMKLKHIIISLISIVLMFVVVGHVDAYASTTESESTTQSESSKKKSKKNSSTSSSKNSSKKSSTKSSTKKSSSKSRSKKNKEKDEDDNVKSSSKKSGKKRSYSKSSSNDDDKSTKNKKGKSSKDSSSVSKTKKNTSESEKEGSLKGKKTRNKKNSKEDVKENKESAKKSSTKQNSKNEKVVKSTSKQNTSSKQSSNSSKKESEVSKSDDSVKKESTASKKQKEAEELKEKQRAERETHDSLVNVVNKRVVSKVPKTSNVSGLKVKDVKTDHKKHSVTVDLTDNFTHLAVTQDFINSLEQEVSKAMPNPESNYRVNLNVGKRPLSYYINRIDRLKAGDNPPFVTPKEPYVRAVKGMDTDIVAIWHSHGRYYKGSSGWQWQRPFLFESVEDTYTMGYVLPYIVPMLENAGAYVMLPRERDPNIHEVIVDNDTNEGGMLFSQPYYKEVNGSNKWELGEYEGFIYDLPDFRDTENPFECGTYRQVKTVKGNDINGSNVSKAGWYPDIPEDGEYAIYISYKSLPNSTEDAHYTINYSGGTREFIVNQTMGGSTWIYLGTFPLEAGYSDTEPVVVLDNLSKVSGKILTADAVKIGGGMGNIARSPSRNDVYADPSTPINEDVKNISDNEEIGSEDESDGQAAAAPVQDSDSKGKASRVARFSISGMPRFVEGARYWMHWAGIPEYVYSPYHGKDDYKDDYTGRGHWVNYLAGGSRVLPNKKGLGIPVDVCMALHSDAGIRKDDSVVGTLGIYYTNDGARYTDGTPRQNSRMLTDMMMRQIVGDIRSTYEPNWTRRQMWDKSYLEARVPEVPTTLIELMSHQNFGDMIYGLDPNFRFVVGRAAYKALGRFVAQRKGREFVVQPLPVNDFAIQRIEKGKYKLSWQPTTDKLEPTATPKKYIIFERTNGNLGFRKIAETKQTSFVLKVSDNEVHSFKILAANDGGVSFPSEVLSLREGVSEDSQKVLIVNGFTRISAPGKYSTDTKGGFDSENDFGVPYIRDLSFTGHQKNDNRRSGNSWGVSNNNYVTKVIAGNTFDFVSEHGLSLGEAGYGFVSCSLSALENGKVSLSDYKLVDLVLGKQKTTIVGKGHSGVHYRAFSDKLQSKLTSYVEKGGNLFVSGAYVVSDLFDERSSEADHEFARNVLGASLATSSKHNGRIGGNWGSFKYNNMLNDKQYIVEKPDALEPEGSAITLLTFNDDKGVAAVSSKYGRGKVITMSVPFESITEEDMRDELMKSLLQSFK